MNKGIKEEKKEDIFYNKFNTDLLSMMIPFIIAITLFQIMNIFFNISITKTYCTEEFSLKFSVLIGIIVYTFCFALLKKTSRATITCFSLIFFLSFVNYIKILYTNEPIYFSDINFLKKVGSLSELAFGNISFKLVMNIFCIFLFYIIFLVGIIIVNHKFDLEMKSKKTRILIIIIDILLVILLFFPNTYLKNLYLKVFFNTDNYLDYDSYINNITYYLRNGMINGMYGKYLNDRFSEPKDYNEEVLNNILSNTEYTSSTELGKPNIIVVLAESFFDINQLEEVKFDKQITSNFNNLKKEGKLINLVSPTYGGMSENVAFELFTGGSMNYFPKGYIPIMSLYSDKSKKERKSIINVLNDNGYDSKIVFGKDDYNSEKALRQMGFKEYQELVDTMGKSNINDNVVIGNIIHKFESKENNERLFYAVETYEGHMPYSANKYKDYDINIVESNLSEEENITLRSYSQAIYNMDKELYRLYNYIKDYKEPTIILFLGDHLPFLYTSNGKNVINELNYFNTDDELLNYYRKYNTQCLLLANFDISNIEFPEYSGVDLLLPYIINKMDIENIDYYEWLNTTREDLTASNRYISLDKNGNRFYTNELNNEMKNTYDLKNKMQYMFFIK